MHIAFLNPQGNFDPGDSHWTEHPDFGGQLVYVKQVALAMAELGHHADILTRQIVDPDWPEFSAPADAYPNTENVRILRFPCGPQTFLRKEDLWPHLAEWVGHIARHYGEEDAWPDLWTGHYADGGLSAALLQEESGIPFTFTAHSLGAWKVDRSLEADEGWIARYPDELDRLAALDDHYHFAARIEAERVSMARGAVIITSTREERYTQYGHPAYRDVVDVADDRRFAMIPPGVNLQIFDARRKSPREDQIRETIAAALDRDIPAERRDLPAVIAWSRLDPKKNYLGLTRAFTETPDLRERANLIMITRGLDDPLRHPEVAGEAEQAVLRPIADEVEHDHLWGAVSSFGLEGQDAAAALYRWGIERRSVFCLPAEHEPFGLSLIEAMAVGLPAVATCHGGPQEITDGGRCGLLADPDNPAELGEQLLRLVGDPAAWQTYADRGRERVLRSYSWRRTAESYLDLARQIARGERAGDPLFPLPDFVCHPESGRLPRIEGWRRAGATD